MMKLDLEPAAFLLSLFCLIYSLTVNKRQYIMPKGFRRKILNQHFMFLTLLVSNIISAVSSVIGAMLVPYASERIVGWQYFFHVLYFVFHSTLSICFAFYIMNVNGASIGRDRSFFIGFSFPYIVAEAIVLTNGFTGFAFRMDEQFVYHRGTLMPLLYLIGLTYFVSGFIFFFRFKKAVSRNDAYSIATMMLLSAFGVMAQAIHSELMIELFFESLTFLGLMLMIEERNSHTDSLTGALNRHALADANRRLIENDQSYQLIFVKLSNMHVFLRMFNGKTMAEMQVQIVQWLSSLCSEQNFYCFREGDFVLLYPDATMAEARETADRIIGRFNDDWISGDAAHKFEVAVSIIRVPEDVSTLEDLMGTLNFGYSRIGAGSRLVSFAEMSAYRRDRKVERALRDALKNDHLQICYRPIRSLKENRIIAAEAVLFVDNDLLRGLPADMYLMTAVQCGLIWDLGLFAFEGVCRFLREKKANLPGLSYVEIRIPTQHFMYEQVVSEYERVRTKYGVSAEALNLEFMEDGTEGDTSVAADARDTMRALGYTFSYGDFGTGYFDMEELIDGGYKNVRIGKTVLWDALQKEGIARMLEGMVKLIHDRGYCVMVDGVETPEQLALAEEMGASLVEGPQVGGALTEEELVRFIAAENGACE